MSQNDNPFGALKSLVEKVKAAIISEQLPIPDDAREYFEDMRSTKLEDWDDAIKLFKQKRPLDEDEYGTGICPRDFQRTDR